MYGKTILCFILVCSLARVATAQSTYYVSPSGEDKNPGTLARPLRTIAAALAKVKHAPHRTVFVYLRQGKYFPGKTIDITPELLAGKAVTISAYRNEKVLVSAATPLHPEWKSFRGAVLQAQVGRLSSFDQLFYKGKALPMARYPNYDSSARVFNGTREDAIDISRIRTWKDPVGAYVHALHLSEWGDFHYRVSGRSADTLIMTGGWQNNRPAPMHKLYRFVENIFEELDAPGEWYYNAQTGVLYLYPPQNFDRAGGEWASSALNEVVRINGDSATPVANLTITGLTFTGTSRTFMLTKEPLLRSDWAIYRGGAVVLEGAENVGISRCEFEELGGNAIFISKYNRRIKIEHNHIHDIGASAIAFVGDIAAVRSPLFNYASFIPLEQVDKVPGPKTANYPRDCLAYDNLIHDIGRIEKQVAGVQISMAMNISVSHNTIYNVPRAGINIGDGCWGGHKIEYNDVFNTVLETGDHGAFNSWGRDRYWQSDISAVDSMVEKFPAFPTLDAIKPITLQHNRFRCEHGWDIDLDDGSSNYRLLGNVCLNGGLKLREGFIREVRNNIIINNTFHPHVWYANSMDVFAQNIVTAEYAPIRIRNWGKMVDSNFFIEPQALAAAHENQTDRSSRQGNPGFINERSGDFRVKPASPALRTGFRNFPMDEFGVVSGRLKQKAKSPRIDPVRTLQNMERGTTQEWLGAVIKNLETLGEQSASGTPDRAGVLVVKVGRGSLAEAAGLKEGDVIRKINGKEVAGMAEMINAIQVVMWQGEMLAEIWRNQQSHELRVPLK